jgi:hypothetical protein
VAVGGFTQRKTGGKFGEICRRFVVFGMWKIIILYSTIFYATLST